MYLMKEALKDTLLWCLKGCPLRLALAHLYLTTAINHFDQSSISDDPYLVTDNASCFKGRNRKRQSCPPRLSIADSLYDMLSYGSSR